MHFGLSDLRGSFVNMRNLEQLLNGFIIKTLRFYKVVNHYSHFVTYSQASKHPSHHTFLPFSNEANRYGQARFSQFVEKHVDQAAHAGEGREGKGLRDGGS